MQLAIQSQIYITTAVYHQTVRIGAKPLEDHDQRFSFFATELLRSQSLCNILSDERMSLSFTIAAGSRQRSHSRVLVLLDPWPYFTVWDSRLSQPGEPGPCTYTTQEQGGPVIAPGTAFPFRRLLRLAGLRWSYSNPPPHWIIVCFLVTGDTTCQQNCSLATAVVLSPVYTAVTWQWVYMSQYYIHRLYLVQRFLANIASLIF
jgi:hypothetical protein